MAGQDCSRRSRAGNGPLPIEERAATTPEQRTLRYVQKIPKLSLRIRFWSAFQEASPLLRGPVPIATLLPPLLSLSPPR
jgi:hypothetical protein